MKKKPFTIPIIMLAIVIIVILLLPKAKPMDGKGFHGLLLNEIVSTNRSIIEDEFGDYSDYIELYNDSRHPIDLTGYGLSDDPEDPLKWQFPAVLLGPSEFLLVFASGRDTYATYHHTNFSISKEGEPVLLSDPAGHVLTLVDVPPAIHDMSYSLITDDQGMRYVYMTTGTPLEHNTGEIIVNTELYMADIHIDFSVEGGFYAEDLYVDFTVSRPNLTLHYTLDGSNPTIEDEVVRESILIHNRDGEKPTYALNQNMTFHTLGNMNNNMPRSPIPLASVLRVAAFSDGIRVSDYFTKTYFVMPEGADDYNLPVMALTADPYDLFDPTYGIYILGDVFFDQRVSNPDGGTQANYNQRGIEWERPFHMAYYDADGTLVYEAGVGGRIFGGWSRANAKKSFRLIAREDYEHGVATMDYPFMPNAFNEEGTLIDQYRHILLRTGANDWDVTIFRDIFMQSLVSDVLSTQGYEPVIVFLNGEYWGVYNIRERMDRHYVASHFDLHHRDVAMLGYSSEIEIQEGDETDLEHHQALLDYVTEHDLRVPEHFNYVSERVDLEDHMQYYSAQIYFANTDWPGNNLKVWRYNGETEDPSNPFTDGRYRYLLYDTDFGFGLYDYHSHPHHNTLAFATRDDHDDWPTFAWATVMLRKLLQNSDYQTNFITLMLDDLNTRYREDHVLETIDAFADWFMPEIPMHITRWRPWPTNNVEDYNNHVEVIKNFASTRPDFVRTHMQDYFNLSDDYELFIETPDLSGAGHVVINDRIALEDTDFNGIYFKEIPVTLTAIPSEGYRFVGWTGDITTTETTLVIQYTPSLTLQPIFEKTP